MSFNLLKSLKSSAEQAKAAEASRAADVVDEATRSRMLSMAFAKPPPPPILDAASLRASSESSLLRSKIAQQAPRRWALGDVYAPHDLSAAEARKWKKIQRKPKHDIFDQHGASSEAGRRRFNPNMLYRNFALLTRFTSETGRIMHRRATGLRGVNQRRMAKAVRRAVGLGLLPSVHRHPEIIKLSKGDPSGFVNF